MRGKIMNNERDILYSDWEEIPAMIFLDINKTVYKSSSVRKSILAVLREGASEEYQNKSVKRRSFNVNELKELLYSRKEIEISTTNLYFHLNVLEEAGMIKIVTTLLEGPYKRNKTKYYGRVARNLFITDQEKSYSTYESQFNEFKKLADLLNLPINENLSEVAKKLVEVNQVHNQRIAKWLMSKEDLIEQEELNTSEIFEFLKLIDRFDPEYATLFKRITDPIKDELSIL
jgi:DNA-binding transcriptional ArsR family regulator